MKVQIIETGKKIQVYKHRERGTYVSTEDYNTEFKKEQLKFL